MRFYPVLCILTALMFLTLPVSATGTLSLPFLTAVESEDYVSLANGENRYGYLQVQSVEYTMKNMDAEIVVTYRIEPWISFLVYLFGKQDLKKRVLGVLQYPEKGYESIQDVEFTYVNSDYAVLTISNAALDNQDNSYWIRPHSFGCTIPTLTFIINADDIKTFTNVKDMPKGIGYFRS